MVDLRLYQNSSQVRCRRVGHLPAIVGVPALPPPSPFISPERQLVYPAEFAESKTYLEETSQLDSVRGHQNGE